MDFKKFLERRRGNGREETGTVRTRAEQGGTAEQEVPEPVVPPVLTRSREEGREEAEAAGELPEVLRPLVGEPFSFINGPAGTGKTFLAKAWEAVDPSVQLAATTGIAAVNLGGDAITINSLLKYFDTASLEEAYTAGFLTAQIRRHRRAGLRRILLDEVSMLDGRQLTILVRALDEVNGTRGGWETSSEDEELADRGEFVGLTLVGDFAQLPPVKAPFAFESAEWSRFEAHTLTLTAIRRQADPAFVGALQALRQGRPREALEVLRDCLVDKTDTAFAGPTLLAKNEAVDRYNALRLDVVQGAWEAWTKTTWGELRKEWKNIPEVLRLKPGCLVMVLANSYDPDAERYRYVNGDLGTYLGKDGGDARVQLQRTGRVERVKVLCREHEVPLEVGEAKALRAAGQGERIKDKRKVVGAVTYLPLRVAYATTVHKSQGLSLDQVQVNLREPFMSSPGMVYVALSRARTQAGLRVVGSPETFVARATTDPRLKEWL